MALVTSRYVTPLVNKHKQTLMSMYVCWFLLLMNLIVDNLSIVVEIEYSLLPIFQGIFRINDYDVSEGIISEHMRPHIIFAMGISTWGSIKYHCIDRPPAVRNCGTAKQV